MRRALLVVVGFAIVTITLTWLWTHGGQSLYGQFLKIVAPPIYDLIGFEGARVGAFRQRYINFIPFVGLVLVTPGIALRRRALGLMGGLVALSIGHLALNLTEGARRGAHLPFVPSLLSDALPFVFWIVVAYPVVSVWFARALQPPEAESHPGERTEAADTQEATDPGSR